MDQYDAAADEVVAAVTAYKTRIDGVNAAVPDWVEVSGLETLARWAFGAGTTCIHDPGPRKPRPVYACAWRPGLVACADCVPRLFRLRGDADRRCDQCGSISADGVFSAAAVFGALTFFFGLCPGCRDEDR